MLVFQLAASNDRNGNPRRLFLIVDTDGNIVEAIDEGYNGTSAYELKYPDAKLVTWMNVPVSEYNTYLKEFEK